MVPAPVCVVSTIRPSQASSGVGVSVGGDTRIGGGGGVLLGNGVGVAVGEGVRVGVRLGCGVRVGVLVGRGAGEFTGVAVSSIIEP